MGLTSGQVGAKNIESINTDRKTTVAGGIVKDYLMSRTASPEAAQRLPIPTPDEYTRQLSAGKLPSFMLLASEYGAGLSQEELLARVFAEAHKLLPEVRDVMNRKYSYLPPSMAFIKAVNEVCAE